MPGRDRRVARSSAEVHLNRLGAVTVIAVLMASGCRQIRKGGSVLSPQQTEQAIAELRVAYGAFNRGDIDAAVRLLDPQVEWTEPAEFPGGGSYHGIEGARRYLTQSRAGAAQVISEPERFIPSADRIVVFVHARVLPKNGDRWQDVRLADVYTLQDGRLTQMHAFAKREDALHWVGIGDLPK
jgi:ketosteroid isomerase-like protein